MKYFYDGQEVQVISRFSDMWNVRLNRKGTTEVISVPSELIEKIEPTPQVQALPQVSAELKVQQQALEESLNLSSSSSSDGFISINNAQIDDLRKVNGVGKRTATKLIENRPDTGYTDINHLEKLNPDVRLDFNTLNEYIKFD